MADDIETEDFQMNYRLSGAHVLSVADGFFISGPGGALPRYSVSFYQEASNIVSEEMILDKAHGLIRKKTGVVAQTDQYRLLMATIQVSEHTLIDLRNAIDQHLAKQKPNWTSEHLLENDDDGAPA